MRLFSRDQAPSADPDFDKADTGESLTGLVRIGLLAIGAAMCVALTGSLFRLSVQHGFREMAGLYAWMRHVGGVRQTHPRTTPRRALCKKIPVLFFGGKQKP